MRPSIEKNPSFNPSLNLNTDNGDICEHTHTHTYIQRVTFYDIEENYFAELLPFLFK